MVHSSTVRRHFLILRWRYPREEVRTTASHHGEPFLSSDVVTSDACSREGTPSASTESFSRCSTQTLISQEAEVVLPRTHVPVHLHEVTMSCKTS